MKKNKGFIIISVLELLLIIFLCVVLYDKWYVPNKKSQDFKNSIKNISTENVGQIIDDYKTQKEKEEILASIPEISNDILNGTEWVCYSDNSVIAFKNNYFVWYTDSDLSSDNALIGQFSYYKGEKAFNLLGDSLTEAQRSENDSVLMMDILSSKTDGEETLEETQYKYLFGYYKDGIMSFIDISTYSEYNFVKIDNLDNVEEVQETADTVISEDQQG